MPRHNTVRYPSFRVPPETLQKMEALSVREKAPLSLISRQAIVNYIAKAEAISPLVTSSEDKPTAEQLKDFDKQMNKWLKVLRGAGFVGDHTCRAFTKLNLYADTLDGKTAATRTVKEWNSIFEAFRSTLNETNEFARFVMIINAALVKAENKDAVDVATFGLEGD